MITYNHEAFIKKAIEGVLMQQTDFNIEFVISNDSSTDNTHAIIEELIATNTNHNIVFSYYNQKQNLGVMPNFVFALQQCQGKYIALCEGDDYWIDSKKLQEQVSFLEENTDYVVTYHNANVLESNRITNSKMIPSSRCEDFSEDELKRGVWMPTLTRCFRNNIILPKTFIKVNYGDFFLNCIYGQFGKAKYLDFVGGVYRKHVGGVHSSISEMKDKFNLIHDFKIISKYFLNNNEIGLSEYYNSRINRERYSILKKSLKTTDFKSMTKLLKSYVQ